MTVAIIWTVSLALILTLALRPLCRRWLGPEAAFMVWALAPLLVALSFVPLAGKGEWSAVHAVLQIPVALPVPVLRVVDSRSFDGLWLGGLVACLLHGAWVARVWRGRLSALPSITGANSRSVAVREASIGGPAVLAGWHAVIVLPVNFAQMFSKAEADLALSHELTHVQRLDHRWLLFAEVFIAVFWFHPLAWWCRGRFQLDMELACDAALLRFRPGDRSRYADALLRHGTGVSMGWAAGWHRSPQALQRLRWIARAPAPGRHPRAGMALLLSTMAGLALAARQPDGDVVRLSEVPPPVYPAAAIREGLHGTVIVDVDVSAAGVPGDVRITQSAGALLDGATIDAVRRWHFMPTVRHGLPVAGTARIPIDYELSDEATPAT